MKVAQVAKECNLDREPQFVVELTKELNKMLGIRTKLSIFFYSQIDRQTK